jgi:hypothetical protein
MASSPPDGMTFMYVSLVTAPTLITTRLLTSRVATHNPIGTTRIMIPRLTMCLVAFQVVAAGLLQKQIVWYRLGQIHQKATSISLGGL